MGLLPWCELWRERSVTDIAYQRPVRRWKPERCDRIALVLQGGGALGAYQAGVFQALSEADIEPDWVTGVSIGAINSAIIAGNSKQWRLKRLRTFWERGYRTQDLELHPGWRRLSQGTQRRQFMDDSDPRPAGLFLAAPSNPVVQLCRSSKRHELL